MMTRYLSPAVMMCMTVLFSSLAYSNDGAGTANIESTPNVTTDAEEVSSAEMPKIDLKTLTIIGYHEITPEHNAVIPDYAVTTQQFELHLDWLQKNGYHFVTVSQLIKANEGKYKRPEIGRAHV